MSHYKAKLLLIISVILVSALSNILSTHFFEFEGRNIINHNTALALKSHNPSQNNTGVQSTTTPRIYKTNNSSSDVSAFVDKANSLYTQGNYTQAIQLFDKALALDPNFRQALNGKGDALYSLTNDTQGYENAIQYYDKALAIDPKDSYALNGKGNALSGQGNNTQAITYYDKALAIDPNDKVTLSNRASTLYDLGNYTQALQYYNKALATDPNYRDALNGKGLALERLR